MLQRVIVAILVATVSTFTVHQMAYQRDCVDLECERTTFEKLITHLGDSNGTITQCRGCQHCTITGYSVCVRPRESGLRARRAPDETIGVCGCTHSIPTTCDAKPTRQKPTNESIRLYNICYLSALQSPPRPQAENRKTSVIVTIEPFWLQPYWKALHLSNLTIHYEFPVTVPENCDGDVIPAAVYGHNDVCSASLQIEMSDPDSVNDEDVNEDQQTYNYYDDDGFSEVQFDRAVFVEAEHVKFWYTVDVVRPRQLNVRNTDNAVIDIKTVMDSDSLEFDLETSKYGFGDSGNEEVAPRHTEKEKERENGNVYEIDEGRPVVTTENEETESYQAPKEKTAEEVAREVDFFAADDEVQPISEDEEGESIVADTDPGENTESNEQLGRKMDEAQADRQTDDNLLDLSTVETFESDEELVKIDEMDEEENENDREKDEQTGDETNARTSGGRTHTELDDKPQIGDEQKEHEEKEKEAQEDGRTGESEGGSEVDANTEAVIGGSNGEDEKEAVSNEDDVKDSDEVSSSVLQLDRETDHRPWQPITYVTSTTPVEEIESAENEDEEGVYEEEEDDRIKLHDDTAAVPALDEWSSTNNLNDEEIIVLTTPTSLDGTADNNSVISNGTETVFQEFFNNFGVNHVSLTVYILGLAILACLLLLCVLCCIRKRETLCARCSGSNGRRDKNAHSNGINDSYKYTSANTQSLNVHPERERLNE